MTLPALVLILALPTALADEIELVEVKKIWDAAPHSAFTDLIRHDDRWFCAFREGQGHVSPDGALRVITSEDGQEWTSAALITSEDADLRDPKLSRTPDGRLMIVAAAAMHPPSEVRHRSMVWYSQDGHDWGTGHEVGDPNFWLWRVTWHDGSAYGIGYQTVLPRFTRLYRSDDGAQSFQAIVPTLAEEGSPNEATLVFLPDATALTLQRREIEPNTGLLGRSRPPYTDWTWTDLGQRIGGPNLLRLPDGRFLAAVRLYDGGARTALCWLDPDTGRFEEALALPSGGDTSYAGMVWHDGLLWVSYYSSHEGKTSIYLARVRVPEAS